MGITIYPYNILESGTVTVTGDADTGYPESRLYDRTLSLFWKDTVTEAKEFEVDQGAGSILDVDLLFISGHNFDGEDMQWQHSDNGSVWSDAVTDWSQSGNGQIVKALDPALTHRYWKVTLTSMTDPECAEIFMSLGHVFTVLDEPRPVQAEQSNLQRFESIGGMSRRIKLGDTRRAWTYDIRLKNAADRANLLTVLGYTDGIVKPVFVKDMDGNYYFMELLEDPRMERAQISRGYVTLFLLEAL